MAGTLRDGAVASYNELVGVKLDIDDAITILTPSDVPLQGRIASSPTESIKVEWLDEELTPQTVTASAFTGTGPWTVTVDAAAVLRDGDVVTTLDSDTGSTAQWVVTGTPDETANTAVFTAFGANTVTAPGATATFVIVGQYRKEGGDPNTARTVDRTTNFNYTQIGEEAVTATRTARKRAMYGLTDPYDHEVMKKFKELAIRFERAMVLGQRVQSTDATKRSMGGVLYYLSTNAVSDVKANVKAAIGTLVQDIYNFGGTPAVLWVSPAVKAAISAGFDPTLRRTDRSDTVGGYVVDKVLTDFGELEVVVNRFLPRHKALILQSEFLARRTFDGYFHELLAKTGDADTGHIVGEMSLELRGEKAHGVLTLTDA